MYVKDGRIEPLTKRARRRALERVLELVDHERRRQRPYMYVFHCAAENGKPYDQVASVTSARSCYSRPGRSLGPRWRAHCVALHCLVRIK